MDEGGDCSGNVVVLKFVTVVQWLLRWRELEEREKCDCVVDDV